MASHARGAPTAHEKLKPSGRVKEAGGLRAARAAQKKINEWACFRSSPPCAGGAPKRMKIGFADAHFGEGMV